MAALGNLGNQFETVLGLARQFVRSPTEKRAEMEYELAKFFQVLAAAELNLEESLKHDDEENSGDLQEQYDDLQSLIQSTEELESLLTSPSDSRLEAILSELRDPLCRLIASTPSLSHSDELLKRPEIGKAESELPLEFHILRALCREVAEQPIRNRNWKSHIQDMRSNYQKATRRLKSAISKESCPEKEMKLLEMRQGYRTVLKGLKRIESFDSTLNPADLDNGQMELLEGYAKVKTSGQHWT